MFPSGISAFNARLSLENIIAACATCGCLWYAKLRSQCIECHFRKSQPLTHTTYSFSLFYILSAVQEALSLRSVWILPRWGRGSLSPLSTVLHVHFGQRI